jgi:hypothetical protein
MYGAEAAAEAVHVVVVVAHRAVQVPGVEKQLTARSLVQEIVIQSLLVELQAVHKTTQVA